MLAGCPVNAARRAATFRSCSFWAFLSDPVLIRPLLLGEGALIGALIITLLSSVGAVTLKSVLLHRRPWRDLSEIQKLVIAREQRGHVVLHAPLARRHVARPLEALHHAR